jgi:hypothetical protein
MTPQEMAGPFLAHQLPFAVVAANEAAFAGAAAAVEN